MTDLTLIDAIESAMFRVRERIAAAIVAGDDLEAGRIIREAVNARLADWRELERPDPVSDEVLTQAFRDVYAAQGAEQWAEMTADMRAHEAGE